MLLYSFNKKPAAESYRKIIKIYGESSPSIKICEYWFRWFKSGDFDISDKRRSGQPKKFEDAELQELLDENSTQSTSELVRALNIGRTIVTKRLHTMGEMLKERKWLPHELSQSTIANRLNICISLIIRQRKKSFLCRIVTDDKK